MTMRPYRGLTKEGKWVYGWYFKSFTSGLSFIITDATNHPYRFTKTKDCFVEVIPETVGQNLGWKNKYGQELWEGDILSSEAKVYKGVKRTIIYDPAHCGWCFVEGADISNAFHWKVTSNIHESPELIEEPK